MNKKPSEDHAVVLKPSRHDGHLPIALHPCHRLGPRDVLAAAVEADRLVPGGGIVVVDANGPEDDDE